MRFPPITNLERFDGVKYGCRASEYEGLHDMYKKTRSEGFGAEVKRRIMLGSFVLSAGYYDAYYLKALRTRALIKQSYDHAFTTYDLLLAPAAPSTAPRIGVSLEDPLKMYLDQPSLRFRSQRPSHRDAADRERFRRKNSDPCSLYV